MRNLRTGFTLVEVLVVIILLVGVVAVSVSSIPMSGVVAKMNSTKMLGYFSDVESGYSNYIVDKGEAPVDDDADNDFLDETELVPAYIFTQANPLGTSFGTLGYTLDYSATKGGWFVCAEIPQVATGNENDKVVTKLKSEIAQSRRGTHATNCGETSDVIITGAPADLYFTYWISRTSD